MRFLWSCTVFFSKKVSNLWSEIQQGTLKDCYLIKFGPSFLSQKYQMLYNLVNLKVLIQNILFGVSKEFVFCLLLWQTNKCSKIYNQHFVKINMLRNIETIIVYSLSFEYRYEVFKTTLDNIRAFKWSASSRIFMFLSPKLPPIAWVNYIVWAFFAWPSGHWVNFSTQRNYISWLRRWKSFDNLSFPSITQIEKKTILFVTNFDSSLLLSISCYDFDLLRESIATNCYYAII